jgi:hypothetical protein
MPPITVARPSARNTLPMSEALMRLPTISPVAMVLPVDSTAVIISTMIIVTQATTSNFGMPNRNGWVKPIGAAAPTLSKFMSPSANAIAQPMTSPSSTAMVAMKPRKMR